MKTYYRVLTIAGSDSGGGAGIQADIKAISACGCYAASAITAITVQNTLGVQAVEPVSVPVIEGQIRAVLDDIGADAIKIGMLHSSEVVLAVARLLKEYAIRNVVLDPVMVSTSGHRLIEESAIDALKNDLIPFARVITPNLPEAEILLGQPIGNQAEMAQAAQTLGQQLQVSVLLKAGHLKESQLEDVLYEHSTNRCYRYSSPRIYTNNTHGTGCTLSSALASFLAKGYALNKAVEQAILYMQGAIAEGADYQIGHGFGPVDHFYHFRKK